MRGFPNFLRVVKGIDMTEHQAKQQLSDLLARFTPGSLLHLLAEVLRDSAGDQVAAAEPLRDAVGALFVVGIGIDAVMPGSGR